MRERRKEERGVSVGMRGREELGLGLGLWRGIEAGKRLGLPMRPLLSMETVGGSGARPLEDEDEDEEAVEEKEGVSGRPKRFALPLRRQLIEHDTWGIGVRCMHERMALLNARAGIAASWHGTG